MPQLDTFARIKTSHCHVIQANQIRLGFLHATEWIQYTKSGAGTERTCRRVGLLRISAAQQNRRNIDADAGNHCARCALIRMFRRDMRDLVTQHGSQLMLILRRAQNTAEHGDLAAGHDKCVDLWLLDDRELPVHFSIGAFEHIDDGIRDTGNVVDRRPVLYQGYGLPQLIELPRTLTGKLGVGFQYQLRPAAWRGRTRGQQKSRQHQ